MSIPNKERVILHFQPNIEFTVEQAARYLGCSLEKANELLMAPGAKETIRKVVEEKVHQGLDEVLKLMYRSKWPSVSDRQVRQDVTVVLPSLSTKGIFG